MSMNLAEEVEYWIRQGDIDINAATTEFQIMYGTKGADRLYKELKKTKSVETALKNTISWAKRELTTEEKNDYINSLLGIKNEPR